MCHFDQRGENVTILEHYYVQNELMCVYWSEDHIKKKQRRFLHRIDKITLQQFSVKSNYMQPENPLISFVEFLSVKMF